MRRIHQVRRTVFGFVTEEGMGKSFLSWNHTLKYDASKGVTLGPGKTLNLLLKAESLGNAGMYKVGASAKPLRQCPEGFKKLPNGHCEDINECDLSPSVCGQEANCVNEEGGYKCVRECEPGFKVKWDGSCIDIDECALGTHNCPQGKQCLNLPDIDECASSPCVSPLTCLNQMGSHLCLCPNGLFEETAGGCAGVPSTEISSRLLTSNKINNNCEDGFMWNGAKCEDIDECAFDSPCQYECHNSPGNYSCKCPEGYQLIGHQCIDINECKEYPCASDQLCFNILGSFDCIDQPCPNGYQLQDLECIPNCQNCSLPPIRIHLVTLPRGIRSGTSFLRLTAYDTKWRVLYDTKYSIKAIKRFQKRLPFILKTSRGQAILQNVRPLLANSRYKLGIKAISNSPYTKTRFSSEFLVFISVSDKRS
ncbi:unnamed protein product [Enterobius vermicularis]|uniref:EGF-like domain-containing protein n=1 Tax=Enterobius vermicularis TaxID=51028 RepID=A0A0N4V6G9_ENTVE|nr:unnamed protein product [Enterobius vermicularis]